MNEWLIRNNYWVSMSDSAKSAKSAKFKKRKASSSDPPPVLLTHVMLCGGRASVPRDKLPSFYEAYANTMACAPPEHQPSIAECIPKDGSPFKMFFDVDLATETSDRAQYVTEAASCCRAIARHLSAIVSRENDTDMVAAIPRAGTDSRCKMAAHVVCKDLIVHAETALAICAEMKRRLAADGSEALAGALDASVYRSGLRMVGARKREDRCSVYAPTFRLRGDSIVEIADYDDRDRRNIARYLAECSILPLSAQATATFTLALPETTAKTGARRPQGIPVGEKGVSHDLTGAEEARLRSVLPDVYARDAFTSVRRTKSTLRVTLASRFCHNLVKGEHSSNHVLLLVDSAGVWQRCFCTCDTVEGRKSGRCKDFAALLSDALTISSLTSGVRVVSSATAGGALGKWCRLFAGSD